MSPSPLAFITGASSGIGQALAASFMRKGYQLALVARRTDEVERWARSVGLDAARYRIYAADVAVIDAIAAAGQRCIEELGVPDVVVANAGISIGMDTADRGDIEMFSQLLAINNVGLAATFHPFVAAMERRGSGRLVGIASVAGIRGLPGHGAYCASKAGVISYCESLRGELRASGVRVVTIAPGYIRTPLTANNKYSMPFLMEVDDFAQQAVTAIEAGVSYRVIPWQMGIVAKLLRALPNALYDIVLAGRPRKPRRTE